MTPEVEPLQRLRTGLGHEGGRELQLFDFFFFFYQQDPLCVHVTSQFNLLETPLYFPVFENLI